ncbi:MAG: CcdB family protein [Pseudomonadota bacterium]
MRPNDIYRWRGFRGSDFALVAQGEIFDFLETVIVIPLFRDSEQPAIDLINPVIDVEGVAYQARTELIGAAPRPALQAFVTSADAFSVDISRAINRLTQGF